MLADRLPRRLLALVRRRAQAKRTVWQRSVHTPGLRIRANICAPLRRRYAAILNLDNKEDGSEAAPAEPEPAAGPGGEGDEPGPAEKAEATTTPSE